MKGEGTSKNDVWKKFKMTLYSSGVMDVKGIDLDSSLLKPL